MPVAHVNGLSFDYAVAGAPDAPPVLLIMGLGMPALLWPPEIVDTLVAQGFRVITFDNRDCGASSRLAHLPVPNVPKAMTRALMRRKVSAPYDLTDMALDTACVLDAAGVERAHVVGVSMGGMIAQELAARLPQRVLTLTSIMSSSGNPRPGVALGKVRALRALLRRPPEDTTDIAAIVDHLMFVLGVIGSPGYPQDEQVLRSHLERAARRGLYPDGSARQIAAILASGDRRPLLQRIAAPTLVIHGASDPLVRPAAGHDTAQNIPGARLEMIDGMGHDFPPALMAKIALMIAQHCKAHGAAVDAVELPVDVEVAAAGTPAAIPAALEAGQLSA
jgi:pimeloyl-ACP methyl ester carboxylesterase